MRPNAEQTIPISSPPRHPTGRSSPLHDESQIENSHKHSSEWKPVHVNARYPRHRLCGPSRPAPCLDVDIPGKLLRAVSVNHSQARSCERFVCERGSPALLAF